MLYEEYVIVKCVKDLPNLSLPSHLKSAYEPMFNKLVESERISLSN